MTARGTVGGVQTNAEHDLRTAIKFQQEYDVWPNGNWHSHPSKAYFSATDIKDQDGQIDFLKGLGADGEESVYYELVVGASLDWLIRRFRMTGGDEVVYYDDIVPTLNGVPIETKVEYKTVKKGAGGGKVWKPDEEVWMKGRNWQRVVDYINAGGQWGDVKILQDDYPNVIAYWQNTRNITSSWRAAAHFIATYQKQWRGKANYLNATQVVQIPLQLEKGE
jgi:hypothetical protein